jgi:hypothetical protein
MMKTIYKSTFPVCFITHSTLLVYKKGLFSILDLTDGSVQKIAKLKMSFKELLFNKIPLFSRIFRKGIRCGIKISEKKVLFVAGHGIFELDLQNNSISEGFFTADRSRPLVFSEIVGIAGFTDGIYFGGYKSNPDKDPVSIYKRVKTDTWEEVYQFPENTIEHIHNIVADPYRNIVYIMTGDFDQSAGIWISDNGFMSVTPILTGEQLYRGCVGFPTQDGLIYATDSPFYENSIRLLKYTGKIWETIHLKSINGPSIYGCKWHEDFLFSTSVEGDGRNQNILYKLTGKKRGIGINENYSFIYKGNVDGGFKEIYKCEKDWLPFYLFQFGVLIFPSGINMSSCLPVFHMATTKYSTDTFLIEKPVT